METVWVPTRRMSDHLLVLVGMLGNILKHEPVLRGDINRTVIHFSITETESMEKLRPSVF